MSTKNKSPWESLHDIFSRFEEFFGISRSSSKPASRKSLDEDSGEELQDPETSERKPRNLDDLLKARTALRGELDSLKARLSEQLSERDVYLVIFPIVAHFDELVQTRLLQGDTLSWPTLQNELFQINDAGELFFDTLDDILLKPQTLPLVLEVFFFCLEDGFQGRYNRNPGKIEEYLDRLKNRIPIRETHLSRQTQEKPVTFVVPGSPLPYYAIAVILVILCYGILVAATWLYDPFVEQLK